MSRREQQIDTGGLAARLAALPGVGRVREAAERSGVAAYLVGGSVRDALLGVERADLDVAVEGDHLLLARALDGTLREHPPFLTATVTTPDGPIDVAATRAEAYPRPGALPVVRPARLADDLGRRDFSVNAVAVPLLGEPRPVDPHGGIADLRAATLRVLHARSFVDDPTRALRAARYSSRLGLEPEPETRALLARTDLETISAERVDSELRLLAAEAEPARGFGLLSAWGLVPLPEGAAELIDRVAVRSTEPPWDALAAREDAILAIVHGDTARADELASRDPGTSSARVAAAHGHSGAELLLARALGAAWLDDYLARDRHVRLEISGHDLIEAGIEPGPPLGAGLAAALAAKLDGTTAGRDDELAVAIGAARQTSG